MMRLNPREVVSGDTGGLNQGDECNVWGTCSWGARGQGRGDEVNIWEAVPLEPTGLGWGNEANVPGTPKDGPR